MSIVISCFELPVTSTTVVEPGSDYRLHRALGPQARFRYITVGEGAPTVDGVDGVVLSGRYELHHTGERPAAPFSSAEADSPIIFINCLAVEPGREDAAFAVWREVNDYMVVKPGYRWHRLHRRLDDRAPFGFVNVVEWESLEAWDAAHDDGFRSLTAPSRLPFTATPTLCQVVGNNDLHAAGRRVG